MVDQFIIYSLVRRTVRSTLDALLPGGVVVLLFDPPALWPARLFQHDACRLAEWTAGSHEPMSKTLFHWLWSAGEVLWGITLGWTGVVLLSGEGSPLLFPIALAAGLAVGGFRRWLKRRATISVP